MEYSISEISKKYLQIMADFNCIYSRLTELITEEYGEMALEQMQGATIEGPAQEFKKAIEGLFMDRVAMQVLTSQEKEETEI